MKGEYARRPEAEHAGRLGTEQARKRESEYAGRPETELTVSRAGMADVDGIMRVMDAARRSAVPGWFVSDDTEYVRRHVDEQGFILVAKADQEEIVGFLVIDFPGICEGNLGVYRNLEPEALLRVVHMDSAAVLPEFRGNHLQERLFRVAEEILDQMPWYRYRMCTVHPENRYSLNNLERLGYRVLTEAYLYGGLPRYVMWKTYGGEDHEREA